MPLSRADAERFAVESTWSGEHAPFGVHKPYFHSVLAKKGQLRRLGEVCPEVRRLCSMARASSLRPNPNQEGAKVFVETLCMHNHQNRTAAASRRSSRNDATAATSSSIALPSPTESNVMLPTPTPAEVKALALAPSRSDVPKPDRLDHMLVTSCAGRHHRPRLLITGCGRSGTHAIAVALQKAGVDAVHEVEEPLDATTGLHRTASTAAATAHHWPMLSLFGRRSGSTSPSASTAARNTTTSLRNSILVSWPAAAYAYSQLHHHSSIKEQRCYSPILKVHREPLAAISSLVNGFNEDGACPQPKSRPAARGPQISLLTMYDLWSYWFASQFIRMPDLQGMQDQRTNGHSSHKFVAGAGWANMSWASAAASQRRAGRGPCSLTRSDRIRLALHYWVGWNRLTDTIADRSFGVEGLGVKRLMQAWCELCPPNGTACRCTASALRAAANGANETRPRKRSSSSSRPSGAAAPTFVTADSPLTWRELREADPTAASIAAGYAKRYGYRATDKQAPSQKGRRLSFSSSVNEWLKTPRVNDWLKSFATHRQPMDDASVFPRIHIIGSPKSGTTSLYEALLLHPNICGPKLCAAQHLLKSQACTTMAKQDHKPPKELSMWYGIGALKMNAINAHTYSAHFQPDWDKKNADAKNCSAFVDGTPTRLASWHAPKELLQLASQMGASFAAQLRLVAVLREPVSRHLSWYNHRLSTSNIKLVAKEKRKENEAFWNVVKDRCGTSFWKPREGWRRRTRCLRRVICIDGGSVDAAARAAVATAAAR